MNNMSKWLNKEKERLTLTKFTKLDDFEKVLSALELLFTTKRSNSKGHLYASCPGLEKSV